MGQTKNSEMGFHWYFQRLQRMSPSEVAYRIRQQACKRVDRHRAAPRVPASLGRASIPVLVNAGEAYLPVECIVSLRHRAHIATAGQFSVFGCEVGFNKAVNWHHDPKTGNQWPVVFWGDINYRDGTTVGGIKFAWELNRLHHLPVLAAAARATGEQCFEEEVFHQIGTWLEGNPYPRGINWISGIELGIRLVNVVYALKILGVASLHHSHSALLAKFVSLHGHHLYRYPSKHSSCANHAVAEALGMFVAGLFFPDLPHASRWKAFGTDVLEREVSRQIYPDGSSFEHSIPYLQFVLDHFVVYYLLCYEYSEPCAKVVEERLQAALGFMDWITEESGYVPSIGDDDDGYLLRLNEPGQSNFISLLNTGAVLFDRPEWIRNRNDLDIKTRCLLGAKACSRWSELTANGQVAADLCYSRFFPDAGLVVVRESGAESYRLVANCGPLGLEPLGGHGHADALSFTLTIGDRPILVDPGTYLYQSGGKWRHYFRSTAAHSTVRIDGVDQATIVSDFMFKDFYRVAFEGVTEGGGLVEWSASHNGYERLKSPVRHKRRWTCSRKDRTITIEDTVECTGEHLVECFFHFHPDCEVRLVSGNAIVTAGTVTMNIHVGMGWDSVEVIAGEEEPILGWYSPSFNRIQPTSVLVCRDTTSRARSYLTTLSF